MSGHIARERALFIAALAPRDPERLAAERHAQVCEACDALLREGTGMLQLLDRANEAAAVESALEARITAAVFAGESSRRARLRWEQAAWVLGALLSALMIALDGRAGRPLEPALGLHCLRFEQAFALLSFGGTVVWMRVRGRRARLGALRGSVVAMTGALVGQVLLRTRCEAADAALHLLLFHGLGVLVAGLLGGLLGRVLERRHAGADG
jgi:hypothetical protein